MKTSAGILTLCLLMLVLYPSSSNAISIKCVHTLNYKFFDLKPLMKDGDEFYTVTHKTDTEDRVFRFDFCEPIPEIWKCGDFLSLATEARSEDYPDTCINLTKKEGQGQTARLITNKGPDHVQVDFTSEDACEGEENHGVSFEVFCDSSITDAVVVFNNTRSTACRPVFEITHKAGCKVGDLNGLWRFVEANAYIFGAIGIILGLYNLILGRKFIRPTIGMIFCFAVVAIIMFLFYVLIFSNDIKKWVGWIILAVAVILGGIAGFFASKLVRVGVFFLGIGAGACIGLLLNNMVFYKINHVAVLWVLMGVFAAVLGVLSLFWYQYIVIICTSILGSYLFIRGISFYAGGYPNEFTIYEKIQTGAVNAVPGTFYAYMVGMLIICIIGIFIQIRIKRREGDSDTKHDIYRRV